MFHVHLLLLIMLVFSVSILAKQEERNDVIRANQKLPYDKYINLQLEKSLDPKRRAKWKNEEWVNKIKIFKKVFERFLSSSYVTSNSSSLIIGARTGQEVVALHELGVKGNMKCNFCFCLHGFLRVFFLKLDVVGIDLISDPPFVQKGDMHQMNFRANLFDFLFTNIVDHSIDPARFSTEVKRVLKIRGYFCCHLATEGSDTFGANIITKEFAKFLFQPLQLLSERDIAMYSSYGS
jgi:hypothetical protein